MITNEPSTEYLEQFQLLAKGTTGKATCAIVEQVLRHPEIFVFGEILEMDCVQKLSGTEFDSQFRLLELFAYGTYRDYLQRRDSFPTLSDALLTKLRMLSLVSLASVKKTLDYDILCTELEIANVSDLETIVRKCLYSGLLLGKLDQKSRRLDISKVAARDLNKEDVARYINVLEAWSLKADALSRVLQECNQNIVNTQNNDTAALQQTIETLKTSAQKATNK